MDVKEIRKEITNYANDENFHSLNGKYGLRLLLDKDNFYILTDCLGYVFGTEDQWNIWTKVMKYMLPENKISQLEPLSLAVYGSSTCFKDFKHLGVVSSNLTIISKWGLSPVFEHPPEHVPNSYGDHIEYFRIDINEIFGFCHPSLHNFI